MTRKATVLSVNKAKERGIKTEADSIRLVPGGVEGDIHQHSGNRELSILDEKHIDDFVRISNAKEKPASGAFAENIRSKNLFGDIRIFDELQIGDVRAMVSQIGKPFHEELEFPGHYVSPQKAIFCKIISEGEVKAGMEIDHIPKTFKTLVITLSDRASAQYYSDLSGPEAETIIADFFVKNGLRAKISRSIIPDDSTILKELIEQAEDYDLILTTGGTGISESDITIETIRPFLDKEIPGITEIIRWKYGMEKPSTLLSRSLAGTIGNTLVFCMPGNPKAVSEYLNEFTRTLMHAFKMLYGLKH